MVKVWCVFDSDEDGTNLLFIRSSYEAAEHEAFTERGLNPRYTDIEEWEVD